MNTFDEKKRSLEIFAYHGKDDEVAFYGYSAKTYENLKVSGFTKLNF